MHYAAVEGDPQEPILLDDGTWRAPSGFEEPERLSWYRGRVGDLIDTHVPGAAGLKTMETIARASRVDTICRRARIEGVILQRLHESRVRVFEGRFPDAGRRLGTRSARKYIDGDDLRGIDLEGIPRERREAILVATAALPE